MSFLLLILGNTSIVYAQSSVANYGFTRVAEGWYGSPAGTTQLIGANIDEQLSATTNIGFDFWYNGVKYTQFKASSNGFITLNTSLSSPTPSNALNSTSNQLIIAPLWDDLKTSNSGGKVHYQLNSGDPWNKQLIIEFYSMNWNASSSDNVITFKVILYQTSNKIEFWYSTGTASVNSGSASIGICGNASGTQQFLSVTPGGTPTVSSTTENATISAKPAAYDHYIFTPHHSGNALKGPGNFSATSVSTSQINISWVDSSSNETGYVIYWSTSSPVYLDGTSNFLSLPANSTSASFTGLNMNTSYFFNIYAYKEALSTGLTGSGNTQWGTPACVNNSSPSASSTNICPSSVSLNWTSGGGSPTGYKLYFGTNNPPTNIVNGTNLGNVLTYNAGALSNNTTYYWRVDPYNGNGTTAGCTVWSFTTATPGSSFTWTGNTSTDWSVASNWSGCTVPAWNSNVTIPSATRSPVVTSSAEAQDLTIQSGGSLTLSSNILHLHGNFTNSGTFTDNANTVMLIGISNQLLSGATSFNNLTLDNTAGATLNSAITVNGVLTLTNGTLTSNGNLTINLQTGGISGSGSGSISGNLNASKTVSSSHYHYISSPLNNATVAELNDDVQIKSGSYSNLYYYNETNSSSVNTDGWTAISNLATSLDPLKGYALYFNGATSLDVTGTYAHTTAPSDVTVTNTVSSDLTSDGWNLVGNPYPSTIDWNAAGWTKINVDNAIYFWDPMNNQYASYVSGSGTNGGTQYIPSMQGFYVRVSTSGGSGTLGMTNSVRVTNTNPSLWKVAVNTNELKLKVSYGTQSDETILRFMEEATDQFDSQLDAYKLMNEYTASLYTKTGETDYSINSIADTSKNISIPLHLETGHSGTYRIEGYNIKNFNNSVEVILEDRFTNQMHNLRNGDYLFEAKTGDATGRFIIHFRETTGKTDFSTFNSLGKPVTIYATDQTIYLNFRNTTSDNATIHVFSAQGMQVAEIEKTNIVPGCFSLDTSLQAGVYVVKAVMNNEVFTQKVYLK